MFISWVSIWEVTCTLPSLFCEEEDKKCDTWGIECCFSLEQMANSRAEEICPSSYISTPVFNCQLDVLQSHFVCSRPHIQHAPTDKPSFPLGEANALPPVSKWWSHIELEASTILSFVEWVQYLSQECWPSCWLSWFMCFWYYWSGFETEHYAMLCFENVHLESFISHQ